MQEAREFFNNSILRNSEEKKTSSDSENINLNEIPEAVWNFARMKGEGVRVPLKFKSKLNYKIAGTNKMYPFEDLTYLLLYKNKEGKFEVEKVTTMPDKDYIENTKKQFSGFVFVEDWYGNFKKIFQYKDGKSNKINIPTGPYADKKNNDKVTNDLGNGGCIYLSGGFACVGAGNGQTCTERPGRYVCTSNGGGITGNGDPGNNRDGGINPREEKPAPGFEGGEGYVEPPAGSERDIIDSLINYPCAQDLLMQLPLLKDDIANIINNTFSGNCNFHIKFVPAVFPNNNGTFTDGDQSVTNLTFNNGYNYNAGYSMSSTIRINQDVLAYATKEYILVTMYHEVLHAFLSVEKSRLGDTFSKKYPDINLSFMNMFGEKFDYSKAIFASEHSVLGYSFYKSLTDAIHKYNPNLPMTTVNAMASAGIFTTSNDDKLRNENERDTRKNTQLGSKCP